MFFGCFDWHSAVHGHWTLVRLLRAFPHAEWAAETRTRLNEHFTEDRIAGEQRYFSCPHRAGFERPYGLAWLLQLIAECREWTDPHAQTWADRLVPLENMAVERFTDWLPKLTHPVRSGEHSQTAFALGLLSDWAVQAQNATDHSNSSPSGHLHFIKTIEMPRSLMNLRDTIFFPPHSPKPTF